MLVSSPSLKHDSNVHKKVRGGKYDQAASFNLKLTVW